MVSTAWLWILRRLSISRCISHFLKSYVNILLPRDAGTYSLVFRLLKFAVKVQSTPDFLHLVHGLV